jgi:hypothetical protein
VVALATATIRIRGDVSGIPRDIDRGLRGAGGERAASAKGKALGESISKDLGSVMNQRLRNLKLPEINLRAGTKGALESIHQTETALREMSHNAPNLEVRVETRQALSDLVRFRKQVDDESTETGRRSAASFTKGFGDNSGGTFGRVAAMMASRTTLITAGLAAATPVAAKFVAALAPAAGVATGAIPGILGMAAASGTLRLAVSGVNDALSAGLTGNTEQYQKALAELAPAQADVTRKIVGFKDQILGVRQVVAQRFFAPLTDDIAPLARTFLPLASQEMGDLAGKLGETAGEIARVARSAPVVQMVRDVFRATGGAVDDTRASVGLVIPAVARLVSSSTPLLRSMSADVVRLVGGFTDWANTAAGTRLLVTLYERGRVVIGQLLQITLNLGAVGKAVFTGLAGNSSVLLQHLVDLTTSMRDFVTSAKGAALLKDLFQTLGVLGAALRGALAGVLPQLASALQIAAPSAAALAAAIARLLVSLGPLLPALARSAAIVADAFVPAINLLAGFLEKNRIILTVIAPALVAYAVAARAAAAATVAYTVATKGAAAIQGAIAFVQLAAQIRSVADAWALLSATTGIAGPKIAAANVALAETKAASTAAAIGLRAVGAAVVVVAALEIIGVVADKFKLAAINVDRLTDSLVNFQQTGRAVGELTTAFGADMSNFANQANLAQKASHGFYGGLNDLLSAIPGVGSAVDALNEHLQGSSFNRAKDSMAALDQAVVQFATTTGSASRTSALWNQLLIKSGMDSEQLARLLPNAYQKVGELNRAQDQASIAAANAAKAQRGLKGSIDPTTGAVRLQRSSLAALNKAVNDQFNPIAAFIHAQEALKTAQQQATAAIRAHGATSKQARTATLNLAAAAIDLQGKAGSLGDKFTGKLTPAMKITLRAAGVTDRQIGVLSKSFQQVKRDADKYDGKYNAHVTATGIPAVKRSLSSLLIEQEALKKGISVSAARSAFNKNAAGLATGGHIRGPGGPRADKVPAMLSNGEFVEQADAVSYYGVPFMKALNQRKIPKEALPPMFARGGTVTWPFPATASKTRIPSRAEALAAVTPAMPAGLTGGGITYPWIIKAARALVGAVRVISTFRRGATTLSGNRSYHAVGRAVDFAPSRTLARRWHDTYGPRTKEEITPWRQYDIWNGRPHHYSAALHAQHSGGNAHVHIAMAKGGPVQLMDRGGTLAPGLNLAYNGTGHDERLVRADRGGDTFVFNISGPVTSAQAAEDMVVEAVKRARRKRRLP